MNNSVAWSALNATNCYLVAEKLHRLLVDRQIMLLEQVIRVNNERMLELRPAQHRLVVVRRVWVLRSTCLYLVLDTEDQQELIAMVVDDVSMYFIDEAAGVCHVCSPLYSEDTFTLMITRG